MMESQLSKSDIISNNTIKESAHQSLLSEAVDFVKEHPLESVAAAAAITVGVYNVGKIAASITSKQAEAVFAKTELAPAECNAFFDAKTNQLVFRDAGVANPSGMHSDILSREKITGRANIGGELESMGDLGAHLHPDLEARTNEISSSLTRSSRFGVQHNLEIPDRTERLGLRAKYPPPPGEVQWEIASRLPGIHSSTIGYGDPFSGRSIFHPPESLGANNLEAIDSHVQGMLSTVDGQSALREFAHSNTMREFAANWKGILNHMKPGEPFRLWGAPFRFGAEESTSIGALENFFKQELGENFGHDIPSTVLSDSEKKLAEALRSSIE